MVPLKENKKFSNVVAKYRKSAVVPGRRALRTRGGGHIAKVISTSSSLGVTLTAGDNPVTITSSGTINATTGAYGLLGPTGSYNVTNYGLVSDTAFGPASELACWVAAR